MLAARLLRGLGGEVEKQVPLFVPVGGGIFVVCDVSKGLRDPLHATQVRVGGDGKLRMDLGAGTIAPAGKLNGTAVGSRTVQAEKLFVEGL